METRLSRRRGMGTPMVTASTIAFLVPHASSATATAA